MRSVSLKHDGTAYTDGTAIIGTDVIAYTIGRVMKMCNCVSSVRVVDDTDRTGLIL